MSVTPFERITPPYEIPAREHHDREAGAQIAPPRHGELQRPHVRGKFLYVGNEKFWVRGVTYGTFRPDGAGSETRAWSAMSAAISGPHFPAQRWPVLRLSSTTGA